MVERTKHEDAERFAIGRVEQLYPRPVDDIKHEIARYPNLKKVSTGPTVHSNLLPDGGLLVAPKSLPKSVYLAYPERNYQVEVYDANAGAARRLALNGLITRVG